MGMILPLRTPLRLIPEGLLLGGTLTSIGNWGSGLQRTFLLDLRSRGGIYRKDLEEITLCMGRLDKQPWEFGGKPRTDSRDCS